MALQFPSASIGQTYQSGSSATYKWNGVSWIVITPPTDVVLLATTASYINTNYGVVVLATDTTITTSTPTTILNFTIPTAGVYEATYIANVEILGGNNNDTSTIFFTDSSDVPIADSLIFTFSTSNTNDSKSYYQTSRLVTTGATSFKFRITRTIGTILLHGENTKVVWEKIG
jgi:hypothetical protein